MTIFMASRPIAVKGQRGFIRHLPSGRRGRLRSEWKDGLVVVVCLFRGRCNGDKAGVTQIGNAGGFGTVCRPDVIAA
jgi:hypothetical protein